MTLSIDIRYRNGEVSNFRVDHHTFCRASDWRELIYWLNSCQRTARTKGLEQGSVEIDREVVVCLRETEAFFSVSKAYVTLLEHSRMQYPTSRNIGPRGRACLQHLSEYQLKKFHQRAPHGDWRDTPPAELYRLLQLEVVELGEALAIRQTRDNPHEVCSECADVANYCAMIAQVIKGDADGC